MTEGEKDTEADTGRAVPANIVLPPVDATPEQIARALVRGLRAKRPKTDENEAP